MTDKETSLEFVERMESVEIPSHSVLISREDFLHLRQIAKTAALIEEHLPAIEFAAIGYCPVCCGWEVEKGRGCLPKVHTKDCWLGRAVADKIKERT